MGESSIFVLDARTNECVHYESVEAFPRKRRMVMSTEVFKKHTDIQIRNDLIDCQIDICSVERIIVVYDVHLVGENGRGYLWSNEISDTDEEIARNIKVASLAHDISNISISDSSASVVSDGSYEESDPDELSAHEVFHKEEHCAETRADFKLFAPTCRVLYEMDILEEEAILKWYYSDSSNNDTLKSVREQILSVLEELDPDIAFIQEVDINCKRSGSKNHFKEIATKLGWKGGFVCEFLEVESEIRKERDQGGGIHGNAIFTKHEVSFRVLDHKHHPLNWEREGVSLREPRVGRRFTLVAEVMTPIGPPILCYCVHLEVFCGIVGRIVQFSEILADSTKRIDTHPNQLIFGDLNTMGHSIARLSPLYCTDRYRFLSLGWTESEWWDVNLFGWHIHDGEINLRLQSGGLKTLAAFLRINKSLSERSLQVMSGFSSEALRAARNPGFYDPWSPTKDITLHNPNYLGLYSAKLDWTLICGFEVVNRWIGNDDYSASDHKYMMVELKFDDEKDKTLSSRSRWENRRNFWRNELNVDSNDGVMRKWMKTIGLGVGVAVIATAILSQR
ncbi:3256_t:CDS:2 [Acaulospora colombiana]|uniref:3256_t:CDS:1 n=1 Tax=Acaulospora colombiana TaxID=27376 RepID=A0ACA9K4G0_9GLOM|nr:3256_t:CDS:2 [Acaulospora colombiana]